MRNYAGQYAFNDLRLRTTIAINLRTRLIRVREILDETAVNALKIFVFCSTFSIFLRSVAKISEDLAMPEGPELHKNSLMVNDVCKGRIFSGKIVKSAVSTKNPEVEFPSSEYTIHAESRGKEMALILTSVDREFERKGAGQEIDRKPERLRILFRFGMSGKFTFGSIEDLHKHAHLNFYTKEKPLKVLSFVDVRRFGRWELTDEWSTNRGPDPIFEYAIFRSNILENLKDRIFDKPLCEVMHNQKYFNGIGNYLRAEIIFRAGIPPFSCARTVLEKLTEKKVLNGKVEKNPDILDLCNIVPKEVVNLPGKGYDPTGNNSDYSAFMEWLQCYYNPEMRNVVDHDGRTMWFKGETGPLVPKDAKSRGMQKARKRKAKKEQKGTDDAEIKMEEQVPPSKKQKVKAQPKKKVKKEKPTTNINQKKNKGKTPLPRQSKKVTLASVKKAGSKKQPKKTKKENGSKRAKQVENKKVPVRRSCRTRTSDKNKV
ncbi:endonuclease 8-like 1 isoform X2 [Acropora muricata]|uniref:endonuclease 8-like 1 isoform X2 n=1 Tax=Acropora muricata TaxID=159855 RepID=UPI0034E5FFAF